MGIIRTSHGDKYESDPVVIGGLQDGEVYDGAIGMGQMNVLNIALTNLACTGGCATQRRMRIKKIIRGVGGRESLREG